LETDPKKIGGTSRTTKTLLAVSGVIGVGIGGALLFAPSEFQASAGITLGNNVSLLSETRAPGGTLLAAGVLILMGAYHTGMVRLSLLLSSLFYLSYGAARVLSMIVDGMPHDALVAATGLEIVVGLLSLYMLSKYVGARNTGQAQGLSQNC